MKLSELAENIIGSEIIKLAAEVNEKIKQGDRIYNFTIGDFDPKEFPIPDELKQYIQEAYRDDQTNYPAADGMPELRKAVSALLRERAFLSYEPNEILIAGGARPLIYGIFRTLVDPGDTVVFGTPSWNNNHYSYLNGAKAVIVETKAQDNFMPSAEDIKPHLAGARLLALCSPQNPTGTAFSKEGLLEIAKSVFAENKRRTDKEKPLFLLYDQIYWPLTQEGVKHYDPVSLLPELKPYTVYVDGISKSLSATGVRVGWSAGPARIIEKMKAVLSHIGAWAPKAEQVAVARYLQRLDLYDKFVGEQNQKIKLRLSGIYDGLMVLKKEGYAVEAIKPQGAIYLTVQFALKGKRTVEGKVLQSTRDITAYLLDQAKLAIVPFSAFGASAESDWYRLSIGTCALKDIPDMLQHLRQALSRLQ